MEQDWFGDELDYGLFVAPGEPNTPKLWNTNIVDQCEGCSLLHLVEDIVSCLNCRVLLCDDCMYDVDWSRADSDAFMRLRESNTDLDDWCPECLDPLLEQFRMDRKRHYEDIS